MTNLGPARGLSDTVVLIDLDDTLIPDLEAFRQAAAAVLDTHAPGATPEQDPSRPSSVEFLLSCAGQRWRASTLRQETAALGVSSWEALWSDLDHHDAATAPQATAYAVAVWYDTLTGLGGDPQDAPRAAQMLIAARERLVQPYPGTGAALDRLAGQHQLWLVTHGSCALQRRKLRLAGLEAYFQRVIISAEIGHLKDDPAFAALIHHHAVARRLSIRAVIGDSTGDLALAAHGRWPAIHICAHDPCEQTSPGIRHQRTLTGCPALLEAEESLPQLALASERLAPSTIEGVVMVNVGILGGGQLAQMLAQAATQIGVRVFCIEHTADTCAALAAPVTAGDLTDVDVLNRWVNDTGIDVVTLESEFIDASIAQALTGCQVRPSATGLAASQERLREKQTFADLAIPVPAFAGADNANELRAAVETIGIPCVVKTRTGGYDGKGQIVVRDTRDLDEAAALADARPVIIEAFVEFDRELSVIAARGVDGDVVVYPVVENEHRSGILHKTLAPAPDLSAAVEAQATSYVTKLLEHVGYVGVLGLELFQVGDLVLGNEFAPRPHNSGHWTITGAVTSQFENHLRAVTGQPLGSARARGYVGMINLIGGNPDTRALLSIDGAQLHLYGKESRPGRKIGHITVTAATGHERDLAVAKIEAVVHNVLTASGA